MKAIYYSPVSIFLCLFLVLGTSLCQAEDPPKIGFTGFVVTDFKPFKTPDGEIDIDLPNPRDAELIETVFSDICNNRNCYVYSSASQDLEIPTYSFVKETLIRRAKANLVDMMVIMINTHAYVDKKGELHFLFADSRVEIGEDEKIRAKNTMSASELAEIILQYKCKRMVLILDCCYAGNTGALSDLEAKINVDKENGPQSLAILCSSGGDQTSQVFVKRHVSLYTGYLLAAISGLGDENRDGKVSVQEIHNYSYSLVGMVSQEQEKKFNVGNILTKNTDSQAASVNNIPIQRPELKMIVKGPNADIHFDIPYLPLDTTKTFLKNNIKDIIQLHHLDPNHICVERFKSVLPGDSNEFGQNIKYEIEEAIHPDNVNYSKAITDRPVRHKKDDYLYTVRGEYRAVKKQEKVLVSVNCQIVENKTDTVLTMYTLPNEQPVNNLATVVSDLNEIATYVVPPTKVSDCIKVSLLRKTKDGGREPVPNCKGGEANDYAVRKGDKILVAIENLTDKNLGFICCVDGLNVLLREGETDADRIHSMADNIKKVRYQILPPHKRGIVKGWMTMTPADDSDKKNDKQPYDYNYFVVQDAPKSLAARLNIDPDNPESPLGSICVFVYDTNLMPIPKGEKNRSLAAISEDEEVHHSKAVKSEYRIPKSDADFRDKVEVHYVFENEEDAK